MATWEKKLLDLCDDPECGYMDFHNLISKAIAEDRRKIAAVEKVLEFLKDTRNGSQPRDMIAKKKMDSKENLRLKMITKNSFNL